MLREFSDAPTATPTAKPAETTPPPALITRASRKKKIVAALFIHNDPLIDALNAQTFTALNASPRARAFYYQLRARYRAQPRTAAAREQARPHPALCSKTRALYTRPQPPTGKTSLILP